MSFCFESLLAQEHVGSGDDIPWSVLRVIQIEDVNCNGIRGWLKGVEYAVPKPPKKPGDCIADRQQLSLVLSLVLCADSFSVFLDL